ncbi:MAG: NUDIX domain-containing protein [Actinoallomurus sp.]
MGNRDFANPRASPGGTPEPFDADLVDTLIREAFEESQVRVTDAVYLGYQQVHRPVTSTDGCSRVSSATSHMMVRISKLPRC